MNLNDFDPRRENDPNKRERLRQIHIRAERIDDAEFATDPEVMRLRKELTAAERATAAVRPRPAPDLAGNLHAALNTLQATEQAIGAAVLDDLTAGNLDFPTARAAKHALAAARERVDLLRMASDMQKGRAHIPDEYFTEAVSRENAIRRQLNDHLRRLKLQRAAKEI